MYYDNLTVNLNIRITPEMKKKIDEWLADINKDRSQWNLKPMAEHIRQIISDQYELWKKLQGVKDEKTD